MREGGCGSRVCQIVCRHVNALDRGDGTLCGGSDSFLEFAEVRSQGGLITHGRGDAAQKGGDFRSCLGESENVIDEQKHVLPPSR
jgi:hypothetical protein